MIDLADVVIVSKDQDGRVSLQQRHDFCFLLSDDASFITGGYYLVDGGYTAV